MSPTASIERAEPQLFATVRTENRRQEERALEVLGYALRLRGIRVQCHVGVSDAERAMRQELVVAVDVELEGKLCPSSDDLETAADYAEVVRMADETAQERAVFLLETYALRVAQRLSNRWPSAGRVRVAVTKAKVPVTPTTDEATVEIVLGRRSV